MFSSSRNALFALCLLAPSASLPAEDKKEVFTVWGKEIGGLQAGLGYEAGGKRVYSPGETVTLVVRVRNVGKENVSFQHLRHFFIEHPPALTNDDGESLVLKDSSAPGIYKPVDAMLAPGKELELYKLRLTLRDKTSDAAAGSSLYGEGTFQFQYERILGNSFLTSVELKFDPIYKDLATGKLTLVVKKEAGK